MTKKLRMITVEDIRGRIEPLGFAWTGDWGWGKPETRRFEGPAIPQLLGIGTLFNRAAGQSSLYIRDNYVSATGHYRMLEELVRPSSYGNLASKAPEWRGRDLLTLMDTLEELLGVNQASDD